MPKSRLPAPLPLLPACRFAGSLAALARRVVGLTVLLVLSACGGGGSDGGGFAGTGSPGSSGGSTGATVSVQIGSGSGDTFQAGVITASNTTLESGETASLRVNVVYPPANASDYTLVPSSTCANLGQATFAAPKELFTGLFSYDYTNNGCSGNDTVTINVLRQNASVASATVVLNMIGPQALTVSFVSTTAEQLSLAGIGGNETAELTFKVAGAQGVPVPNASVLFSINTNVGGASILPGRETARTNLDGMVRTTIKSGTVVGPISVLAVHAESGRQGISGDIVISTGVPAANRFAIGLDPFNPPAWNFIGAKVEVSLIASDAFGNNPTDGTRVTFVSPESGNIASSCLLEDGVCSVTWRSDATFVADGRATIIAYTDGAEGFVDNNGNSVYDRGDGAIADLGEAYADENENGRYDLGEFFYDFNKNGIRDEGNSLWDGPCLDKVSATAICTGNKSTTVYATAVISLSDFTARIHSLGTFPATGTSISLAQNGAVSLANLYLSDARGNSLPVDTQVALSIDGSGVRLQGLSGDTVSNGTTRPNGPYGTTLIAAAVDPAANLPGNIRLVLTIAVPGRGQQQFSWPVVVTR